MAKDTRTSDQQNTEADEQPKGQASEGDSGVAEEETEEVAEEEEEESEESDDEEGDEDESEEVDLLGQAEFDRLKGNPEELRKALNKAATKKFQQLSRERKDLRPYRNLISALNTKPKEAIAALAEQFGIEIVKPKASTEASADDISARILNVFKTKLGPEYEDLAGILAPAIQEAATIVAEDKLKSTNATLESVQMDAAMTEATMAVEALSERHPDWKKHETAMVALSQRMPPGEGMDQLEYLENLYFLVSREGAHGDGVKKAIKKMARSAGNSESRSSTVDTKSVSLAPGKLPTFAEAAAAAKRGERFD